MFRKSTRACEGKLDLFSVGGFFGPSVFDKTINAASAELLTHACLGLLMNANAFCDIRAELLSEK